MIDPDGGPLTSHLDDFLALSGSDGAPGPMVRPGDVHSRLRISIQLVNPD